MNQVKNNQTSRAVVAIRTGKIRLFSCVALCLLLSACSSSGRINYEDQQHKQRQASAMDRWNRCFDKHLTANSESYSDASTAINSSLEICQGHRYDVVAMYPRRLEKGLDKKLVELAYQQGLQKLQPDNHNNTVLRQFLAAP